jgi:serine/threonine protein kinase
MNFDDLEARKDGATPWPTARVEFQSHSRAPELTRQDDGVSDPAAEPGADDAFVHFLDRHWPREGLAAHVDDHLRASRSAAHLVSATGSIGRFQIESELGSGGFATVYLAHDAATGRPVALKVPHPETLRSPDLRRRFEREARAAASLDHPNINPIHETSQSAAEPYIASHYCSGPTLADWLKHRLAPASPVAAAQLIATLAAALDHAHQRGVLHRDLKPANVLLDAPDEQGPPETLFDGYLPRLCDFGLARIVEEDDERTRTGVLLGTPRYMSPEQTVGNASQIGPTTDVYALGVILYELLVGRPPFVGDTELETLRQVRNDRPISIGRLQPNVPRDLDTIAMKCLEKEPWRRYSTAADLAADLQRFLEGQPIVARPVSPARRLRLWTARHPLQAAVLLTGVVLGLSVPLALAWHNFSLQLAVAREEQQRVRAQEFEAQARENERRARAGQASVQHHVYASDMRLAHELLKEGEFKAMSALVDRHDPRNSADADRRGFEWWHLRHFAQIEQRSWSAHPGQLNALAFSADGRRVLTASYADRKAKTWLVQTGELLATFPTRFWTERSPRRNLRRGQRPGTGPAGGEGPRVLHQFFS